MNARLALALSVGLLGCAQLRPMTASPEDYAAYRAFRLARTEQERFSTSAAYVAAQPHGDFLDEVGGWYRSHERALSTRALHEIEDAREYLRVLPTGPHHEEVERFVAAWEREQVERPLREARAKEARERKRAHDQAERAKASAWIEGWVGKVSTVRLWSTDAAAAVSNDPALFPMFRGDDEPGDVPACDAFACHASATIDVEVEGPVEAETLRLHASLRALRAREGVEAVMLSLGHDGFVRWLDAEEGRRRVTTDDRRAEALAFAKNRVERALRASSTCTTTDDDRARTIVCAHIGAIVASDAEDVISIFPTQP